MDVVEEVCDFVVLNLVFSLLRGEHTIANLRAAVIAKAFLILSSPRLEAS